MELASAASKAPAASSSIGAKIASASSSAQDSAALIASAAARPIPESNVFQQYCRSGKHPTLSEIIDKESESDGEALAEVLVEEDGGNKSDENSANVESDDLDVGSDNFALETDSNPSSSSAESESEAESDTDLSRTTLEERVL